MNTSKCLQLNNHTYTCDLCDYSTCKKRDYDKHLLTRKHLNRDKSLQILRILGSPCMPLHILANSCEPWDTVNNPQRPLRILTNPCKVL